jgi:hypothetical protein
LLKPLMKLHLAIRIVVIYCMQELGDVHFPLESFQNVSYTCTANPCLTCTLCSRLPWRRSKLFQNHSRRSRTCSCTRSGMQVGKELPELHSGRSPTQSDMYQMLY